MAVNPYGRTSKRGVVLNWRTVEMLEITELRELRDLTPLPLSQGSYTTGAPQSAGTHAGGGALDVRLRHLLDAVELYCRRAAPHGLRSLAAQTLPGKLAVPHPCHRHRRP